MLSLLYTCSTPVQAQHVVFMFSGGIYTSKAYRLCMSLLRWFNWILSQTGEKGIDSIFISGNP